MANPDFCEDAKEVAVRIRLLCFEVGVAGSILFLVEIPVMV